MSVLYNEPLWTEKYRPKKLADVILPKNLKEKFQVFIDKDSIPNLILSGGPGCGKTTVARAMLEELDCDYIIINGSIDGNIDTLRYKIQNFASSLSFTGKRKYVILDEADGLNQLSFQPALRSFMEEYSKNCGFILTCNFKNKIITPLHSRCTVVDFKINKSDLPELASQFMKRACFILENEGVSYEKNVIVELIKKHHPDWRKIIGELQYYSASGSINSGILSSIQNVSLKELMNMLKNKEFTNMRKWVAENSDSDAQIVYRNLYDTIALHVTKDSVPAVVLIIGKYLYQHAFSADAEINLVCCLTEIMMESTFL